MTVDHALIVETIASFDTADADEQARVVGLDVDELLAAAREWLDCAVEVLTESTPADAEEAMQFVGAQIMAAFMQGAVTGCRLAQAGFAKPADVLG